MDSQQSSLKYFVVLAMPVGRSPHGGSAGSVFKKVVVDFPDEVTDGDRLNQLETKAAENAFDGYADNDPDKAVIINFKRLS